MAQEDNHVPQKQAQGKTKFDPVGIIVGIFLVGVIAGAINFIRPTVGNVFEYYPDFNATATQAFIDCECKLRSDAWLDGVWWDGLPQGKLVAITPKTIVYGEQYQALAFAYSPEKFSSVEIDKRLQSYLQILGWTEDEANIITADIFLDTWGYPSIINFRIDRIPDYVNPEIITIWSMEYKGPSEGLEGLYINDLFFNYDENYSESSKCRRICTGDRDSNWAPSVYEQIIFDYVDRKEEPGEIPDQSSTLEPTIAVPIPTPGQKGYILIENFDVPGNLSSSSEDIFIQNGKVYWTVYRNGGYQFLEKEIPRFEGDFTLAVIGQVNSAQNNCHVSVGIGDTPIDSVGVTFGWFGGGCPVNGFFINTRGAALNIPSYECRTGWGEEQWPWISGNREYRVFLEVSSDDILLDIEGVGQYTGTLNYSGSYDTLFVGLNGGGDWPSCSGEIELIEIYHD